MSSLVSKSYVFVNPQICLDHPTSLEAKLSQQHVVVLKPQSTDISHFSHSGEKYFSLFVCLFLTFFFLQFMQSSDL